MLHARAHVRRIGAQQRNCLALHVRAHERAVGVVVLEKRNQAGRHRDQLLRADVDVLNFVARLQYKVARLARVGEIRYDPALFVQLHIGLRDDVLVLFPGREVFAMRFILGGLLFGAQVAVGFFDIGAPDDVADFIVRIAGIQDLDLIDDRALHDFTVRAFDEAEFVDPGKARKG